MYTLQLLGIQSIKIKWWAWTYIGRYTAVTTAQQSQDEEYSFQRNLFHVFKDPHKLFIDRQTALLDVAP